MFHLPSWLPFIVISVIIFFLWLKAYRYQISKTESDRPWDVSDAYEKVWDEEYECFIWREKKVTDRQRLERNNPDV